MDRQTKIFIAVFLLVAAVLLMANHLVSRQPIEEWVLAGGLLALSIVFWVWAFNESAAEADTGSALTVVDDEPVAPVQEWIISKDVVDEPAAAPVAEDEPELDLEPEPVIDDEPPAAEEEAPVSTAGVAEELAETEPELGFEPVVEPDPELAEESATEPEEEPPAPIAEEVPGGIEPEPQPEPESEVEPAAEVETPPGAGEIVDDLTRIEGIGPKYRDALLAAGINTFAQLAELNIDRIVEIANDAGMRRAASMDTWAEQAKLAAANDWGALDTLQKKLSGGRRD